MDFISVTFLAHNRDYVGSRGREDYPDVAAHRGETYRLVGDLGAQRQLGWNYVL